MQDDRKKYFEDVALDFIDNKVRPLIASRHPDLSFFVKLDWSPHRKTSRGGKYKTGYGINMAMIPSTTLGDGILKEYASFAKDPEIGSIFYGRVENILKCLIVHECAHVVQYYLYKKCRPHGPEFKNVYRWLRKELINPFLPDQKDLEEKAKFVKSEIFEPFYLIRKTGINVIEVAKFENEKSPTAIYTILYGGKCSCYVRGFCKHLKMVADWLKDGMPEGIAYNEKGNRIGKCNVS